MLEVCHWTTDIMWGQLVEVSDLNAVVSAYPTHVDHQGKRVDAGEPDGFYAQYSLFQQPKDELIKFNVQ